MVKRNRVEKGKGSVLLGIYAKEEWRAKSAGKKESEKGNGNYESSVGDRKRKIRRELEKENRIV